jgi:hypothetical protein
MVSPLFLLSARAQAMSIVLLPRACISLKILACISFRISTVIQVTVHHLRIYTDLMGHLQFHLIVASTETSMALSLGQAYEC